MTDHYNNLPSLKMVKKNGPKFKNGQKSDISRFYGWFNKKTILKIKKQNIIAPKASSLDDIFGMTDLYNNPSRLKNI